MPPRKKLIEVALPLDTINYHAAREKSIRHGHPSTLHLWWARRPLAACRAVLFASLVDDPSSDPDRFPTEAAQAQERERLFDIIRELVQWKNVTNAKVLEAARAEIRRATGGNPPPVLDPFAGGGSIPLEAQRLGLEAHASDLNPVAVLINKALIEIPPRFAGQSPVNPAARRDLMAQPTSKRQGKLWRGAAGLAEDVRHYGEWMRDQAEARIGHLYPPVTLPPEHGGGEATVIAWLWARTVRCPNPACRARMPLVRSFWLGKKKGKKAWVEPLVERPAEGPPRIRFEVRTGEGKPQEPPKAGRGAKFSCLACGEVAEGRHIKKEAKKGRMGAQLMAIVAEGNRQRVYLSPTPAHEAAAEAAKPRADVPNQPLANDPRNIWCVKYGLDTFDKLFTDRQLVALTTFSDLVGEARAQVHADALAAGLPDDGIPLAEGGAGASAYADALAVYLGLAVSKATVFLNNLARWRSGSDKSAQAFGRQSIAMVWDFAETNPFAGAGGDWRGIIKGETKVIENSSSHQLGSVRHEDAQSIKYENKFMICTDPPYYDNIGYANLSDFFYVWLRKTINSIYPNLFSTLLVPKMPELVADPHRFEGGREEAQDFFEKGLQQAFEKMHGAAHPDYPLTVFYAFKQAETVSDGTASTGWETMLEGLMQAGFTITGTWPSRTEGATRLIASGTNALASSIVLVCRPRPTDASLATRRDFLGALQRELAPALRDLQRGNIAPVDLAQASIGPGMAIFSRYARVLESDGSPMRVRTALALINQALDAYLTEQEGEYDADTRWALAWFEQHAFDEGSYGDAETLSKAKNTSVQGMVEAGILAAKAGKVRLLTREELPADWSPATDQRPTIWESTQHLIRTIRQAGEQAAAELLHALGPQGDAARDLAYRLYTLCERKGWAQEALAYNSLVVAWSEVGRLAGERATARPTQGTLDL